MRSRHNTNSPGENVSFICKSLSDRSSFLSTCVVARKVIRVAGSFDKDDVLNEIRVFERLSSQDPGRFLVQLYHHERKTLSDDYPETDIYLIDMELCQKNLAEEIRDQDQSLQVTVKTMTSISRCNEPNKNGIHDQFSVQLSAEIKYIARILCQILEGLQFIHSQNLVHRDLKPENGFTTSKTLFIDFIVLYSIADERWKIADFGCTTEGTSKHLRSTTTRRGTAVYRSPEILQDGRYNCKSDIWSFGCIVYEICTKKKAFTNDWDTMIYHKTVNRESKNVFENCDGWQKIAIIAVARKLSQRCIEETLQSIVQIRPTSQELLEFLRELTNPINSLNCV